MRMDVIMTVSVPAIRILRANAAPVRTVGAYVLYWMTAARRRHANPALERAVEWAVELGRPLVVLEALRLDYPWASLRLHRFVCEGMRANAADFNDSGVAYMPYVEPRSAAGKGLLAALAEQACVVVGDQFPSFFLPRMVAAAVARLPVACELVDGNGVMPLAAVPKAFERAVDYRRFWQGHLLPHLLATPAPDPLAQPALPREAHIPPAVLARWPAADLDELLDRGGLARLAIDQTVGLGWCHGGAAAGRTALAGFLTRVSSYREDTRDATRETSGLAPYLHFGHLSAHQTVHALLTHEDWDPGTWAARPSASREGWWHLSPDAEAVLDQLVTWRELGYAWCHFRPDHDSWSALPAWARTTLELHSADPRPVLYTPAQLEAATTHDPLWNAAQRQLIREGRIHTYLRMLWGKKILEWSPTPQDALALCFHLNNKYALDGRNPNSATGITWVFGAHDRPWAPQRPIFGSIRYMSSASAMTKVDGKGYLKKYGAEAARQLTIF